MPVDPGEQVRVAREMTRALRDSEIDAVVSSRGVALISRGEIAADLARAVHEERQRLSAILHDHIQQLLVASRMQLAAATKRPGTEAAQAAVVTAAELIQQALDASRDLSVELDPPALSQAGLRGGLEWLAGWMGHKHGLVVDSRIAADAEPEEEGIRLLLFHGCRELLLNVVKHAAVSAACLELRRDADVLVLIVEDRGRGMAASGGSPCEGIGLARIRRAVEQIHGALRVVAAPGQGTRIEMHVPVHTTTPPT